VPKVVSNPLANFLQGVRGYWQPSGKFVTGCLRLLETLWQILQRVLTTFANSTYLPEGGQHPLILGQRVLTTLQSNSQRVLDNFYRYLQEGCPSNKEGGNLSAIPLKKLKVKINIQKGSSSNKVLSLYTTGSSSQSHETVPLSEEESNNRRFN
jgi:hypothetical protein